MTYQTSKHGQQYGRVLTCVEPNENVSNISMLYFLFSLSASIKYVEWGKKCENGTRDRYDEYSPMDL